ncbi:MAG: hypothetical protein KBG84_11940 [Planctomycetes bacterium]|nr:hypothetical protein [Planctomycetota bacterium]
MGQGDGVPELGVMVAAGSNVGYTNVTLDAADGGSCTLPDDYALESHTFASKTGSGMSRRLTAQKP